MCTNILFLRLLYYFKIFIQFIGFIVPIILIIKIVLDFYKNMIEGKATFKESFQIVSKRIIATIIIFLIPTMVNVVMSLIEDTTGYSSDYQSCMKNISNLKELEELEKLKQELEEKTKIDAALKKYAELKNEHDKLLNYYASSNLGSEGTYLGQKYDLTNDQLRTIAKICQREQGSAIGAAAEASLMANRFELYGSSYGTGGDGLYNYVLKCRWWNPANTGSYKEVKLKEEVINSVIEVLVMGNRTLELYVDEHDCIDCGSHGYDIFKISNNGKVITDKKALKNHDNYIKDVTIIYNKYGAVYTFSKFPTETSDPFGYTVKAKDRIEKLNKSQNNNLNY